MVKPVATVNVVPNLPESLTRLVELTHNLRWAWDSETVSLFRRLSPELWEKTGRNPVRMLGLLSQKRLEMLENDPAFMAHYQRVCDDFDDYMAARDTWYGQNYGQLEKPIIAYFSMEFGLTECLQNYSGGLGILSGDHLKSASDLGLPLIGMGLIYQEGYFQQYLNADGYQQESYPVNDFSTLPVTLQHDSEGNPLKISVPMPGRELYAQIWKVQVGRVPLYLLDTNVPDNPLEEDRDLTDRLYGGDRRSRIRQEILMGIGGIRALEVLELRPTICHMNEGHSAFLILERIRQLMDERGVTFAQAREICKGSNVFTIHTPVPAGLERFGFDLIDEHFTEYYQQMGLSRKEFIDLGRENMGDYELFSMSVWAESMAAGSNGVAKLHGKVSRAMWHWRYPDVPVNEVPIGSVTNGIHMQSWLSNEMRGLFDRYLNPAWRTDESDPVIWEDVDNIPDGELWRTHERRRERLVAFARDRLRMQLARRGASQTVIDQADEVLNPDALTIGFARRFATYKRATLLFKDVERLKHLLDDPDRPVQIIFAGKAHPHDEAGKALIRDIIKISQQPEFRHKVVFLENYDIQVGRYMVQGVDVWLNNPRRPKEASGTSGMKVIYNGGLNCSILDGWWAEGYSPDLGWAIGHGEEYEEQQWGHQDYIESQALYNILEQDIVPTFFQRDRSGLSREWIRKIKLSMKKLAPYFNTRRMVQEYAADYYMPTVDLVQKMTAPDLAAGLAYADWRSKLEQVWHQIKIRDVQLEQSQIKVGAEVTVTALVDLGELGSEDVSVQLYYGSLDTRGNISHLDSERVLMESQGRSESGLYTFTASVSYKSSGDRGISVRVLPYNDLLPTSIQPGLISWA
jgi:glycogen phosphorylase